MDADEDTHIKKAHKAAQGTDSGHSKLKKKFKKEASARSMDAPRATKHVQDADEDSGLAKIAKQDETTADKPVAPAKLHDLSAPFAIESDKSTTFKDLGLDPLLCEACLAVGYQFPTPIQKEAIPLALQGRDIIGIAETGSGKTAAFALPILQALLNAEGSRALFALVLTPTRELAFGIRDAFDALGASIGLKTAVITGGLENVAQAITLAKKPNVIIATPGRIVDHLENTKGFNLRSLKFLVMDEADRILSMDFEKEVQKILGVIPAQRTTFMFSATMTEKVCKLQRASLKDPAKVDVLTKYHTVQTLKQRYLFVPCKAKDCYLAYLLHQLEGNSFMIFCNTRHNTERVSLVLRDLGFEAICLHGSMRMEKRLAALSKFQAKTRDILVVTDVASRGLDIPHVDVVVNFDLPQDSKDYIHRVGRTARAGRSGIAINFVTQYDVEVFMRIEKLVGIKMEQHPHEEEEVKVFMERVTEAQRIAVQKLKEMEEDGKDTYSKKKCTEED